MSKEEDLVLGGEEVPEIEELSIIDNQLVVLNTISELDISLYPDWKIERDMVVSYAMKIIVKAQKNILKSL